MSRKFSGGPGAARARYRGTESYKKIHREYNKNARLGYLYGITLEQKIVMWEAQEGKCGNANCGRVLNDPRLTDKSTKTRANMDHNHATGENRQLLCTGKRAGREFLRGKSLGK